jgi:O-methyltransferase
MEIIKELIKRTSINIARSLGWKSFPPDFDDEAIEIIKAINPYTMTSIERQFALIQAVRYIIKANIPGSIVECGVWRGGSMMAVAYTLQQLDKDDRDLYLFDTYEGMTIPTDVDINYKGEPAKNKFEQQKKAGDTCDWCYATIEDVKRNLLDTKYNVDRIKFIKGKVEDTIPQSAPDQISLLRLDTDWYESTRHELIHLFPRISRGGVLIIDDYGYWRGSRKATDEYLAKENMTSILLNRIDYTGRIAIKF